MHSATTDIAPEIPAFDVRALGRRAALPGAIAAAVAVVLVVTGGPLRAFVDALGRVLDADPGWIAAAVVFELLAFGVEADLALASVLGYRAVAVWVPAPIGLAALAGLRRTVTHWSREDEALSTPDEHRGPGFRVATPA